MGFGTTVQRVGVLLAMAMSAAAQPETTRLVLPEGELREFPVTKVNLYASVTKKEALVDVDNGPAATMRRRFHVLFGGDGADPARDGVGKVTDDSDNDTSNGVSHPAWVIESSATPTEARGYAVARGWYPIIRTSVVRAVSDSTTFFVQVYPADGSGGLETHRVLLLNGTSVKVYDLGTGTLKATLTEGQFVEAKRKANGTITWSAAKSFHAEPGAEVAGFRKYVNIVLARPGALELMKIPD
jgi:hypothetical protein